MDKINRSEVPKEVAEEIEARIEKMKKDPNHIAFFPFLASVVVIGPKTEGA